MRAETCASSIRRPARRRVSCKAAGQARAIAYAQAPNRLFVARADAPTLDVYELPNGQRQSVPLANARTGAFSSGATALTLVPRTQFLYALAEGRLVVVEVHGASPYTAIPVSGSLLGHRQRRRQAPGRGLRRHRARRDRTSRARVASTRVSSSGAVLAFFLVLLSRRLFASPVIGWLVGAAVLLDGSMFAQARIGMNDIYVTTFIVAAWYFIVAAHAPRRSAVIDLLIAGVLLGLAVASKWAAVYALAGVFVLSVGDDRLRVRTRPARHRRTARPARASRAQRRPPLRVLRADPAGHLPRGLPASFGGSDGSRTAGTCGS